MKKYRVDFEVKWSNFEVRVRPQNGQTIALIRHFLTHTRLHRRYKGARAPPPGRE